MKFPLPHFDEAITTSTADSAQKMHLNSCNEDLYGSNGMMAKLTCNF